MLMCPNHHTLIDKNPCLYLEQYLFEMKRRHEATYSNWQPTSELEDAFETSVYGNTVMGGSIITNTGQNQGIMAHQVNIGARLRKIPPSEESGLVAILNSLPAENISLDSFGGIGEASDLADALEQLLVASGWTVHRSRFGNMMDTMKHQGLEFYTVGNKESFFLLRDWLKRLGFEMRHEVRSEPPAHMPYLSAGLEIRPIQ